MLRRTMIYKSEFLLPVSFESEPGTDATFTLMKLMTSAKSWSSSTRVFNVAWINRDDCHTTCSFCHHQDT